MAIILPNEDEAKRLLDFNQKFPVDILDRTLASVNMCIGELPQVLYNLHIFVPMLFVFTIIHST